ncbi:mitochondrial fission 1 protein-like [Artemia franciscana]|uniref:mitochondrial fission 1 protein-like n=1 Tax=Artemia franciscana TaxID=6661 RepID=UPI0032DA8669
MENFIPPEDIKKFEKQYFEELKDGKVTAASKFNFAFCLVKSRYAEDIKNGIKFLEELIIKGDEEARRDYIFYLAYGHFKLKDYPKALEYTETLLAMEPNNRQAMDMKTNIKKKMEIDGLKGMALAAGAVAGVGAIIGLAVSLAKK